MDDFFVGGNNCRQNAAQVADARRHLRRTQNNTDTTARGLSSAPLRSSQNQTSLRSTSVGLSKRCKTLGDVSKFFSAASTAALQSACDKSLPRKTPRAPHAFSEKPDTFKIKSRSFCDSVFNCCPIRQIQFGNRRVRRQRRRVNQPGVGNYFFQPRQKTFAQFLPPEILQIAIPQQARTTFSPRKSAWAGASV